MSRPPARPTAAAPDPDPDRSERPDPAVGARLTPAAAAAANLSDLPVAGLTRRRIALLIGALVAAWVIVLFARQVGEASEAASHADAMRAANTALAVEVAASERELEQIQQLPYIEQQAREYRLGHPREIPFILADDAPPLPADAPGSAAVRLGEVATRPSPLSSWLDLLFGSSNDARDASGPSSGQD